MKIETVKVNVLMASNKALNQQVELLLKLQKPGLSLSGKLQISEQIRRLVETDHAIEMARCKNREIMFEETKYKKTQFILAIIQVLLLMGIVVGILF